MKRVKIKSKNLYLDKPKINFFSSGAALLDCVLGGGYCFNRILNIIGDRSTGKTLLAIEAAANFILEEPNGEVIYTEVESAFDDRFAKAIGFPFNKAVFPKDIFTVEDLFADFRKRLDDKPKLYIVDSLDALTTETEDKREMGAASYGTEKAKQMSELLRRMTQKLSKSNITLLVISQTRDKIGVAFGERHTTAGGRALHFYSSQRIWLSQIGTIYKTVKKIKRPTGIRIKVKCKKNKVGLPFRECEIPIVFNYGIDDARACLEWLTSVKQLDLVGLTKSQVPSFLRSLDNTNMIDYSQKVEKITRITRKVWRMVEDNFKPRRPKKYTNEE